jgi:hypothetical protein
LTKPRRRSWSGRSTKPARVTPKWKSWPSLEHAARTEVERAAPQNAITATDQQIDALVYELYGLTADDSKLVESEEKP